MEAALASERAGTFRPSALVALRFGLNRQIARLLTCVWLRPEADFAGMIGTSALGSISRHACPPVEMKIQLEQRRAAK
jgi:hypothetical protein